MRVNVTKGSDPKGLCAYVLDPSKQKVGEKPVVVTNMAGDDSDTLTREFEQIVDRPRRWAVKQTMAHYSVSLPPGERLERSNIGSVAKALLHQMGHQYCPYFVVQHHDQEDKNDVHHFHVVTSTLTHDGQWVDDSFSHWRLQKVARELESQFSLTPCPPQPAAEQQNLTTGEHRWKERTGEVLPKEKLWSAINTATDDRPTMPLLVTRLKAQGIDVHLWRKGEQYSGISFGLEGAAFAGKRLGPAYSFGGLQRYKGVDYDAGTQNTALVKILNQSSADCDQDLKRYEALQQNLRELYAQYAKGMGAGDDVDAYVANMAIAAGHTEQETANILRQGEQAKGLRRTQGQSAELQYCQRVVQTVQMRHVDEMSLTQEPRSRTQMEL